MLDASAAPAEPQLLRQPAFIRFMLARTLSTAGVQITAVVVGWQIYALTGSTLELGLIGLMQFLPMLVLTIPAGHLADQYDRRTIVRICQIAEAAAAAVLAIGSHEGWLSTPAVFAAIMVLGAARDVREPDGFGTAARRRKGGRSAPCLGTLGLRDADRDHRGSGAGRRPLYRRAESRLCGGRSHVPAREPVRRRHRTEAPPATARAADPHLAALGLRLYPRPFDRAWRHIARPLRRAARGRHGPAAGLCARHSARLAGRSRPAQGRAGRRCTRHLDAALHSAVDQPRGA